MTLNPSVDKIFRIPGFKLGTFNNASEVMTQPGGKGINVAMMLNVLGHDVVAMGFAGNGPGRMVQDVLREVGITTSFTPLEGKTRTNYAIVDSEAGTVTQVRQDGPSVTPSDLEQLRRTYERLLDSAEMVIIAGSLPPGAEPSFCAELVRLAVHQGVRVALNVRRRVLAAALPAKPFLTEPDLRSVEKYNEYDVRKHEGRVSLVRELARDTQLAVVNAGSEVLLVSGEEAYSIQVPACELLGRIRLDDALIAGMIDSAIAGGAVSEIGRRGVAATIAAAASPTGQFASREDIEACIERTEVKPLA